MPIARNRSTLNFQPDLAADFPCRRLVVQVFDRIARSRIGQAHLAGIIGIELAEAAIKGEAFDVVNCMDTSISAERRLALIDAVHQALVIATTVTVI